MTVKVSVLWKVRPVRMVIGTADGGVKKADIAVVMEEELMSKTLQIL